MQSALNSYTYRYLEPTRMVYAIVRHPDQLRKNMKNACFYSIPFQHIEEYTSKDRCNVIFTCACVSQAQYFKQQILYDESQDRECHYKIEKYSIRDLSYYSSVMSMPLIVLITSCCILTDQLKDGGIHYDIFYTNKVHDASTFE